MTGILDAIDTTVTKALLHFDGADGSTTFTDATGVTWAGVGTAQLDTAQKKFGSASLLLDGNSDFIYKPGTGSEHVIGAGDFTLECWVRRAAIGAEHVIYDARPAGTQGAYIALTITAGNNLVVFVDSFSRITGGTTIAANTWYHVALVRHGLTTKLYLNGAQEGSDYINDTNSYGCGTDRPIIGAGADAIANYYNGWIDDLRLSLQAIYTGPFTPPTAAFPDPLTYLQNQRASGRWKDYKLAIVGQNTIATARINQTFSSVDGVETIAYDGASNITDVKAGMECWVGSAAGLSDIGVLRVADDISISPFRVGKVSGVALANDQYLTFVDNYPLAARPSYVTDDDERVDGWIEYDPIDSLAPLVNIGPMARVLTLTGSAVSTTFDAPTIYSPAGRTIAAYAWSCTGASASSGTTGATPSFTFDAAGKYVVNLTLTDSAGASTTVHRVVLVNPTTATVNDLQLRGDVDSGWECQFGGLDGVDLTELRDGAMIVLYRQDYTLTEAVHSQGEYTGCENVRFVGWIDGQSIAVNPDFGTIGFTAHGPQWWADKIASQGVVIQDGTSQAWHHYATLTTDKALYRLARWQSTLYSICDVHVTGDTARLYTCNAEPGTLWGQFADIASRKLMARTWSDNYGAVWAMIPPSLQDSTGKAALEILFDCVTSDIDGEISFNRETVDTDSQAELGGLAYNGTSELAFFSRAPGNIPNPAGAIDAPTTELGIADQTAINRICGDYLAYINAEFPVVELYLAWPLDWPDFMRRIITLTLSSASTPRGIDAWSAKRFYPVSVEYSYSAETGSEYTTLSLAEETDGADGITYVPPQNDGVDDWAYPDFSAGDFGLVPLDSTWEPPVIPPEVTDVGDCATAPGNAYRLTWSPSKITGVGGSLTSRAWFPCTLRPSAYAEGPTSISIRAKMVGDAASHLTAYAIDGTGARLLTGTSLAFDGTFLTVNFAPVSPLAVAGFEIEIDSGPSTDGAQAALGVTPNFETLYQDGGGTNTYTVNFYNVAYGIVRWDIATAFQENNFSFNTLLQKRVDYLTDSTARIYATLFFQTSDPIGYAGVATTIGNAPADYLEGVTTRKLVFDMGVCDAINAIPLYETISYQYGWIGGTGTATGARTATTILFVSTCNIERTCFLNESLVYDVCP